jgi:hypothetical protein
MRLKATAWGGGNQFGAALKKGLLARGHEVIHHLNDPAIDIILLADPRPELEITAFTHHDILHYWRRVNPRAVALYRISDCDERKGVLGQFNPQARQAAAVVDGVLWASEWLQAVHLGGGMAPAREFTLLNGVDSEIFHPQGHQPWDKAGPLKIVTHHWGRVWSKGFDTYQALDHLLADPAYRERYQFTFIGNLPDGFQFQHSQHLPPHSGPALADLLRAQHVYLTGAQLEPAGNHHMEGAACGLPLLYLESGGVPQYGRGFGLGFQAGAFLPALEALAANYDHWQAQVLTYPYTAERTAQTFEALCLDLLKERESIADGRRFWPALPPKQDPVMWLQNLRPGLAAYVESLARSDTPGDYAPATFGLTPEGAAIRLPFSCFALKTLYMLGEWQKLRPEHQKAWLDFIQNFQVDDSPFGQKWGRAAFIDPPLMQNITWQTRRWQRWREALTPGSFNGLARAMSAESKQAIATLEQVGAHSSRPYRGFPTRPGPLRAYLNRLDWSRPWASGAHLATLAVFYQTEAPRFMAAPAIESLRAICRDWISKLLDPATGAYFRGPTPPYAELINGAMKILTAQAWLGQDIHRPDRLIATALSQPPAAEGCHLVDTVYVLARAIAQRGALSGEAEAYLLSFIPLMADHYSPIDGGFSYYIGRAQSNIHGVQITTSPPISDLHGTLLLTWAAQLILSTLGQAEGWYAMKP